MVTLGERIRTIRENKKKTQVELGAMVGIDQSYVSAIELDKNDPSIKTLARIANALEMSLSQLMEGVTVNTNGQNG